MKLKPMLIFLIFVLALASAKALIDQPLNAPAPAQCSDIASLGLASNGIALDRQKVVSFFNADDDLLTYYCVKNILGLWDYDFYLEITDFQGQYVVLDNVVLVYGVYPGKTTSANILKRVDNSMLVVELASPNYNTVSSLNVLSQELSADLQQQSLSCGKLGVCTQDAQTTYYVYSISQLNKIIPDISKYNNLRTFSRLILLNVDGSYSLVKLTLGVWR